MKKFLRDEDNFQDFVDIRDQKFPSSQFGYDERFDKLKKMQDEYKRKMYFQQQLHNEIVPEPEREELPVAPRSDFMREKYRKSKVGGFVSVPPKIQSITHYGKSDMNISEDEIQKVKNCLHEYDKFDIQAEDIRGTINGQLGQFNQHFKSNGYPSTFEHSFNYITEDLQLPEHTCNERGFPSRSLNKSINQHRDIMP